jgi:hypothetical protein
LQSCLLFFFYGGFAISLERTFMNKRLQHLAILFFCLVLASCASVVRNPLPEKDHLDVTVLGMKDIRHWGDGVRLQAFPGVENRSQLEQRYGGIMHREHNYLVISGGGANGAYGAGVLKAWSELGTRPEFTIVTGVSTGALISPVRVSRRGLRRRSRAALHHAGYDPDTEYAQFFLAARRRFAG